MSLTDDILNHRTSEAIARIKAGVSLSERDEYGYVPLLNAAIMNNDKVLDVILARHPEIDIEDPSGETALSLAIDNGNESMAKKLLQAKADPNHYNASHQPILVTPLLRHQDNLTKLLVENGASLIFAQDYMNTKMLGHQFELTGRCDIVDTKGMFIEVDLEGFLLEFSLSKLSGLLSDCIHNFSARDFSSLKPKVETIAYALRVAGELRHFKYKKQNYINLNFWENELLKSDIKLLPISFEGHAVTIVIFKNYFILCDRGVGDTNKDKITFYKMSHPEMLDTATIHKLLYTTFPRRYIEKDLIRLLGCQKDFVLPIGQQITGNCSWANVEAAVLAMLYCLHPVYKDCQSFYEFWLEWGKDHSIDACLEHFNEAPLNRKATKAALLSNIFIQSSRADSPRDVARAKKIATVLKDPRFKYILQSYIRIYSHEAAKSYHKNFYALLKKCGIDIKDFQ